MAKKDQHLTGYCMNRQDFYCSGEEEKNRSFGNLRLKRRRFGDRFYKETDKERYPN